MKSFERHQLVWIGDAAWADLVAGAEDCEARDIATHWRTRRLPLVVCRQPGGLAAGRLAVGLPAPTRWRRRKLSLDVPRAAVLFVGAFPSLLQIARRHRWGRSAFALHEALADAGASARIHGSYGWQALTDEGYVHAASDIDLSIAVPDFDAARRAVVHLGAARLPQRLDGEIVFADGQAVAWRELGRLLSRDTDDILVKSLHGPRLVDAEALVRLAASAATA